MAPWPAMSAALRAVTPDGVRASTAAPCASSSVSTCRWPPPAARIRAVQPWAIARRGIQAQGQQPAHRAQVAQARGGHEVGTDQAPPGQVPAAPAQPLHQRRTIGIQGQRQRRLAATGGGVRLAAVAQQLPAQTQRTLVVVAQRQVQRRHPGAVAARRIGAALQQAFHQRFHAVADGMVQRTGAGDIEKRIGAGIQPGQRQALERRHIAQCRGQQCRQASGAAPGTGRQGGQQGQTGAAETDRSLDQAATVRQPDADWQRDGRGRRQGLRRALGSRLEGQLGALHVAGLLSPAVQQRRSHRGQQGRQ